jgi:predicted signal transduction protein with EAL and GGDEF domain
MGVGISLDDFGTGYSSLTYLRTIPAGELKLDRSFVRDVDVNANNAAIVRAVTQLAHDLDMRVVAEGVETEAVARRVKELGCDMIQGYVLSRPLLAEAFAEFVRSRRAHAPLLAIVPERIAPPTVIHVKGRGTSGRPLRDSLRELRTSLHAPPSTRPS